MKRTFVYLKVYERKAEKLGIVKEIEDEFENLVLEKPDRGSLIQGSGGIRKIRISYPRLRSGKSGSYRFFYLDLEQQETVYVVTVISKKQKADITLSERNDLKALVSILKKGVM